MFFFKTLAERKSQAATLLKDLRNQEIEQRNIPAAIKKLSSMYASILREAPNDKDVKHAQQEFLQEKAHYVAEVKKGLKALYEAFGKTYYYSAKRGLNFEKKYSPSVTKVLNIIDFDPADRTIADDFVLDRYAKLAKLVHAEMHKGGKHHPAQTFETCSNIITALTFLPLRRASTAHVMELQSK